MRLSVPARLIVLFSALLGFSLAATDAAVMPQASQIELPPVSWTCPMHPDIVEAEKGICSICKMNLTPVRLESVWSCPIHAVVAETKAGKCPVCRRDLIQVTVGLTWTCARHPEIDQIDRGTCPDGTPMIAKRTLRAHGNHNPQHGGLFFMAPDNWHHLEGAYPQAGVFNLYLYDDYTRPLSVDRMRQAKGRVVTKEVFDNATRTTQELAAYPLVLTRTGHLQAKVDRPALPAQMSAKIRLKDDGPEYRFDFVFPALSKDPTPPSTAAPQLTEKSGPAPQQRGATAAAATPVSEKGSYPFPAPSPAGMPASSPPEAAGSAGANASLIPLPIPETVEGKLAQLRMRNEQIRQLIDRGAFADVWFAAFQAKDLAVALEAHSPELSPEKREMAEPALKALVRTAWLLDAFGDLGNRQQIDDAYSLFASAVTGVESAFGVRP